MEMENLKTVALIGRPNVGKSTLFNRLIGKRVAIETEIAGTTRDRIFGVATWQDQGFSVIDVAGLENSAKGEIETLMQAEVESALDQADLILFIVDWNDPTNEADKRVARRLRQTDKPIILVVNKADNITRQKDLAAFKRFGDYPIMPVSAISGSNSGDLLDLIVESLQNTKHTQASGKTKKTADIRLSIIGRPNVGKSTFLNAIAGKKRAIVSDVAGTTRDVIDIDFAHKGKQIVISDTAGIRRPGKIDHSSIESYSLLRTYDALRNSDVAVLLIDATEGLVALDSNILGKAKEWGKGIVLAVNKIDQVDAGEFMPRMLAELRRKLNFVPWLPVVFVSALEEKNIKPVLDCVVEAANNRGHEFSETELVNLLEEAKKANPQIEIVKSFKQKKANPPEFRITYKGRKAPHLSQLRYLENKLRDHYPLNGTPIFIDAD